MTRLQETGARCGLANRPQGAEEAKDKVHEKTTLPLSQNLRHRPGLPLALLT